MVPTSESLDFAELELPLGILSSYLFFLLRRPISSSNSHYLRTRIEGLKSLAPLLAASGSAQLRMIAGKLKALQPVNFSSAARDLQTHLALVHRPRAVPTSYLISPHGPGPELFAGTRRVLLAFCPAIGIGDEIIFFPLPVWIKSAASDAAITVMSAYQGLWDRVPGVDAIVHYSSHSQLLERPFGEGSRAAGYDLVIFADFEKPGLAPLICRQPGIEVYLEISLGAQYACVVDNVTRSMRHTNLMPEAQISYYDALDCLMSWLGIETRSIARYSAGGTRRTKPGSYRMFVSPFTSKYDPSLMYWTRVLSSLSRGPESVEFVLDPGANGVTESFSSALQRAATAHAAPNASFVLAGARGRGLPLSDVFRQMEGCDAVLCADSFAAHAGPLFGCTTLVIASAGLENWRAPYLASYYFDITQPIADMTAAMRMVLGLSRSPIAQNSWFALENGWAEDACHLYRATCMTQKSLEDGRRRWEEVKSAHAELLCHYQRVVARFREFSRPHATLFEDVDYQRGWRPLEWDRSESTQRERLDHLRLELARWRNTNLFKLLHQIASRGEPELGRCSEAERIGRVNG